MMRKKAQGALEFLTTYGWAFLVILIMIGALGYFGILNPTRYLPERCNVNPEFSCEEFSIQSIDDGENLRFDFVLQNSVGQGIELNQSNTTIKFSSDIFGDGEKTLNDNLHNETSVDDVLDGDDSGFECTLGDGTAVVDPAESFHITCIAKGDSLKTAVPNPGNKLKISFAMSYVPRGKSLAKPISGELFAAVQ